MLKWRLPAFGIAPLCRTMPWWCLTRLKWHHPPWLAAPKMALEQCLKCAWNDAANDAWNGAFCMPEKGTGMTPKLRPFWMPERCPNDAWNGAWITPGIGPDLFYVVSFLLDLLFVFFKKSVLVKMGNATRLWYHFVGRSFSIIIEHMQDIFIYIYQFIQNMPSFYGTYLNPFCLCWRGTNLLRLWGVPLFLRILYDDGKPERTSSIFILKTLLSLKNKHYYLDLYSPTLGTIPFGYWASRVLGPSSKAHDGTRLYT